MQIIRKPESCKEWEDYYYKAEDWGGNLHWAKEDRSAHIFMCVDCDYGYNWWNVDDSE